MGFSVTSGPLHKETRSERLGLPKVPSGRTVFASLGPGFLSSADQTGLLCLVQGS
jgi:hypothetical protein